MKAFSTFISGVGAFFLQPDALPDANQKSAGKMCEMHVSVTLPSCHPSAHASSLNVMRVDITLL
jgi:hypothetical protein